MYIPSISEMTFDKGARKKNAFFLDASAKRMGGRDPPSTLIFFFSKKKGGLEYSEMKEYSKIFCAVFARVSVHVSISLLPLTRLKRVWMSCSNWIGLMWSTSQYMYMYMYTDSGHYKRALTSKSSFQAFLVKKIA